MRMCGHEEWQPMTVTFGDDGTISAKPRKEL